MAGVWADQLDHPIMFVVLITVAVFCMAAIFRWALKAADVPGAAAIFQ